MESGVNVEVTHPVLCNKSMENQIDNCKPGQLLANWLAVLTESVHKLELHAATVIGTTLC